MTQPAGSRLRRFEVDVDAIAAEWLRQCGPHDFGLVEYGCNCPSGEYRLPLSQLVAEVQWLQRENETLREEVLKLSRRWWKPSTWR